jgi:hypothetical protein
MCWPDFSCFQNQSHLHTACNEEKNVLSGIWHTVNCFTTVNNSGHLNVLILHSWSRAPDTITTNCKHTLTHCGKTTTTTTTTKNTPNNWAHRKEMECQGWHTNKLLKNTSNWKNTLQLLMMSTYDTAKPVNCSPVKWGHLIWSLNSCSPCKLHLEISTPLNRRHFLVHVVPWVFHSFFLFVCVCVWFFFF